MNMPQISRRVGVLGLVVVPPLARGTAEGLRRIKGTASARNALLLLTSCLACYAALLCAGCAYFRPPVDQEVGPLPQKAGCEAQRIAEQWLQEDLYKHEYKHEMDSFMRRFGGTRP